jgi:cyclic beta-1,2-glucan synthetase
MLKAPRRHKNTTVVIAAIHDKGRPVPGGILKAYQSIARRPHITDRVDRDSSRPLRGFFRPLWHTRAPSPEKPFRDELLSIERLGERALALAASFTVDPSPRRRARNIFRRFDDNARVLRDAYRTLADDVRTGQFVTGAAEWLLDNFHLITSEIRDIHQHLPGTYYRQLPTLASREQAGHTRIYAMAVELLRHSDSRIDRQQLAVFINSYQRVAPLTIGELWAWPSMLKLALIENLRRLAAETLESRRARLAADAYVSRIEGEEGDTERP